MACGGEMTDLTHEEEEEERMQHQTVLPAQTSTTTDSLAATELARHLGQVSLESSPILSGAGSREARFTRKFSLRELEIQQTIGKSIIIDQKSIVYQYCMLLYGFSSAIKKSIIH